jgi:hypothetical protein
MYSMPNFFFNPDYFFFRRKKNLTFRRKALIVVTTSLASCSGFRLTSIRTMRHAASRDAASCIAEV